MQETDLLSDKKSRISASNKVGEQLYGKNWERILASLEEVDPTFAEFIQEVPYGSVYPRENLSLPYREIAAITALTQLNLKPQLKSHIMAARSVGLSRKEILELFLHIAMFIGFPLVLDGIRVAKEVFDREDTKENEKS